MIPNMIQHLRKNGQLPIITALAFSTIFGMILVAIRVYITGTISFLFLYWNIILAIFPLVVSIFLATLEDKTNLSGWFFWSLVIVWLLFFPNAPYIITDLFHLKQRNFPYWYDLGVLMLFSWNGTVIGFLSLNYVQILINKRYNHRLGWVFALLAIFLGSFGIYLGRYLRWNSWDVITNPIDLMQDILIRMLHPYNHPKTVGVTLLFTILLSVMYITLNLFGEAPEREVKDNS